MNRGKAAAMAGHAFLDSFLQSSPSDQIAYRDCGGTKIVLTAPSEPRLRALHAAAQDAGIPCSLIEDEGHVFPPDFTGERVTAAIGIGPAPRSQLRPFVRRFSLMK